MRNFLVCILAVLSIVTEAPAAEITRVWLSHRTTVPTHLVVNWETPEPGPSRVRITPPGGSEAVVEVAESVTLHHVAIPLAATAGKYRYTVETGELKSAPAEFKAYPTDELRVAIVADWHSRTTKLDELLGDDVHLLLTAGDNIPALHPRCGVGVKDCTKPYGELIDAYPQLFRSVVFMPALGNHDREIRPRGPMPPPEPVYDVEATAFRKFFELPDDEWKWQFDVPAFGVRFVALDLNHIQDLGTTWQTCHAYDVQSPQFKWYEKLMTGKQPPFVVTLHNEKSGSMRGQSGGAWHNLFRRGTLAVTGFGYFAERAVVDGFNYYNTALGVGAKYRDSHAKFFASESSYVLLKVTPSHMIVQLKSLDGRVIDESVFVPPTATSN
jgi:hypothetical protein